MCANLIGNTKVTNGIFCTLFLSVRKISATIGEQYAGVPFWERPYFFIKELNL